MEEQNENHILSLARIERLEKENYHLIQRNDFLEQKIHQLQDKIKELLSD